MKATGLGFLLRKLSSVFFLEKLLFESLRDADMVAKLFFKSGFITLILTQHHLNLNITQHPIDSGSVLIFSCVVCPFRFLPLLQSKEPLLPLWLRRGPH